MNASVPIFRAIRVVVIASLLVFLVAAPPAYGADAVAAVKVTQADNHLAVEVGGKPFTDYYFAAEGGRPYVRPFFYPVRAADGTEVTSDRPKDHPHHRSLWVAFGDVGGADHWTLGKTPADVASWEKLPKQRHVGFAKVEADGFVQDLVWEDKSHEAMLKERRTVRFAAGADGSRTIDLTSEYATATDRPVTFGDTKEAGLCAVRLAASIAADPTITLATGATSTKNPTKKPDATPGDEANVWGKRADWCDESGPIDGRPYGVAILNHPSNPLPARWHVRRYGLMAANNVGASEFDKADPTAHTRFVVEPGKPVTFRYRVVVHAGTAADAKLAERYAEYAK